jgi:hypothetical protein
MKSTLTTLAVWAIVASNQVLAQPRLSVDRETIDLGVVYNGALKAADIKLTNTGTDTLKILSVLPSCGCTTVKQPKSALAPGESDVVKVAFNSTGFYGPATKTVTITTSDPTRPHTTVTLHADVQNELEPVTKSSVLWFGTIPIGKSATEQVIFKNKSEKTITIQNIISKNPGITLKTASTTVPPSGELKVSVTIQANHEGYVSEEVFIETDSKNQLRVPLRVSFVGVKPS